MSFNMECPHCERAVTIVDEMYSVNTHALYIKNAQGERVLTSRYVVCPNPKCKQFTMTVWLSTAEYAVGGHLKAVKELQRWQLLPESSARTFPDYIPKPIREDYVEACRIRDLSPKASATLSRRCLQGIIRDFWEVDIKGGKLVQEIAAIKDKIDATTWAAIDGLRKIGNIGAHMEKDVDLIVEVDPGEANMLIQLIETLLEEWYVGRHEREQRMRALVDLAAAKKKTG